MSREGPHTGRTGCGFFLGSLRRPVLGPFRGRGRKRDDSKCGEVSQAEKRITDLDGGTECIKEKISFEWKCQARI